MSRALAGSCQVPLGGFAQVRAGELHLRGFVSSLDGTRVVRDEIRGAPEQAEELGAALGQRLIAQGADRILAELGSA